MLYQFALYYAIDLLDVALMQGRENSALVGEVLIEGADAYAGDFGDAICGQGPKALALQNPDNGVEDRIDGLQCAALLRLASGGFPRGFRFHASQSIIKYEQIYINNDKSLI